MIAVGAFLLAAVADIATNQTRSSLFGGAAIGISTLALFPRWRFFLGRVAALAAIWVLFNLVRAISDQAGLALVGANVVGDLERRLLGRSPSSLVQELSPPGAAGSITDAVLVVVYLSFFVVPVVLALLIATDRSGRARHVLAATALCLALGTVGFLLVPTSPPWLTDGDSVERLTPEVISSILDVAGMGSGVAGERYSFEPNHLAAMPSVHVAATVILALAIAARWRRASPVVWLYPAAMTLAVVYLGEHHLLDAIAGVAIAFAGWTLAGRLAGVLDRRPVETRASSI